MKKILGSIALALTLGASAQTDVVSDTSFWNMGGNSSLTFSQVSLTNWAAGGQNSASANLFFTAFADYRRDRSKWDNSIQLGYGLQRLGKDETVQKTDDRIIATTSYGYQINRNNDQWFFSALLDFRTQFVEGVLLEDQDSVISRFMAPGYLTIGTGIDYSPNEYLEFSYKPVTGKITIVTDDDIVGSEGAYGVSPGENFRAELGSYFLAGYHQSVIPNVDVESRLELFMNYRTAGNIDVNWQNTILMSINQYLSANFYSQLLYDDDVDAIKIRENGNAFNRGPKIQFKSVFGVGLVYKFGNDRVVEE